MAGREGQIFVRLDSLSLGGPQGIDVAEVHCCSAQAKAPAIHRFLSSVRGENALMRQGTGQSAGVRSEFPWLRGISAADSNARKMALTSTRPYLPSLRSRSLELGQDDRNWAGSVKKKVSKEFP